MCYIYTWNKWVMVGSLSNWIINIAVSDTSRIVNKSYILSQNTIRKDTFFNFLVLFSGEEVPVQPVQLSVRRVLSGETFLYQRYALLLIRIWSYLKSSFSSFCKLEFCPFSCALDLGSHPDPEWLKCRSGSFRIYNTG